MGSKKWEGIREFWDVAAIIKIILVQCNKILLLD